MIDDKKSKKEALLKDFNTPGASRKNRENDFQADLTKKFRESKVDEVSVEFFDEVFNLDNVESGKSMSLYDKIGVQEGLLRNLEVQFKTGLKISNKEELESRVRKYGKNDPIIKDPKTLVELIQECLEDPMLRILLGASLISLILGVAEQGWATGWIEGFSIFLAVFIVVSMSSFINLSKEQQFAKLNKENEKKMVNVRRNGKKIELAVEELLVGDIIFFEIGNVVSVDSIILEGHVEVDQSSLTGESEKVMQSPTKNPFLISGTMITDGECQGVVCAVGVNSSLGKSKLQMSKSDDKTPLQEKLSELADQISYIGIALSIAIFVVMIGKEALIRIFYTRETLFNDTMLEILINAFIIGVTVSVVAIPEGLPMAVAISLGYSVLKLKDEKNLVRHLDASETMGNVNTICTDKTGTLTEGNMAVRSFYFEGREQFPVGKNSLFSGQRSKDEINNNNLAFNTTDLLIRTIVNNITAFIEKKDNSFKGNSTECALLKYLVENKVELDKYHEDGELISRMPFKSDNKYMGSIFVDKKKNARLYLKGAPEIIGNFSNRCHQSTY